MKKAAEKVNKHMNQQFGGEQEYQGPEGEVVIKKTTVKKSSSTSSDAGDYVDFEEVDDWLFRGTFYK